MHVYENLKSLAIEIPPVTAPVAAFAPWVRTGNLVYVSGHIARQGGQPWQGQLGRNLNTATGKLAARAVAIDLIGTLQAATEDLNKIARIVKLMVLVNSHPDFTEQHIVANGASELLQAVFGDRGVHARCAFGVAQIPFGSCVEIDLVAEIAVRRGRR
jgi:enamine deaminase RidA (YjgF/YER057c/UK114 family)